MEKKKKTLGRSIQRSKLNKKTKYLREGIERGYEGHQLATKRDLLIWVWEGVGRNRDDERERVNRERVFWTCSTWQLGRRIWGWSYRCPLRFGTRSSGKFRIW